jgi:Uma2 family endonuclease
LPQAEKIVPLENGARLTAREFEKRYQAMPAVKKAELVEGVVHMPSPVYVDHGKAHGLMMAWLGFYLFHTPGVELLDNVSLRLDADNVVQPDAILRWENGRSQIDNDGFLHGPPELIVEIAASSASYDLHDKKHVYRRNEVSEYLVWRVYDRALEWFRWVEGRYEPLPLHEEKVWRSQQFPGLWLDGLALLRGELETVMATLQAGLAQVKKEE